MLEPLYDKDIQCLACENTYQTKRIRSRFIRAYKHDTDFCSYYEPDHLNPLFYYVSVCPTCGFSQSDEFDAYFPPGALEIIKKEISSNWNVQYQYGQQRSIHEAINTYKLAILAASLKQEKHLTKAGLYMRLAWIYRTLDQKEDELKFLKISVLEYVNAYSKENVEKSDMSEIRVVYLIGEIYRRLQDYKQATQYFSMAIAMKDETHEKRIVELARERWYDIRQDQQKSYA
ncbi:DUF2225 domain-containing protein [Bacillus sp. HMF5848]|uniref:DUF2225 domain-containing protein n=1 Tax=Bacillus sp. HMF5848 TaxID=2495421 RepID=UPI000F78010E|nr:DUF2225 domain-containing protein [Bacillus sp. HMF5848]RSK28429.1 DUF2225 domain-containing protein [Bacillus sp. HMF5848]